MANTQLDFFPLGEGRCQADADEYNIQYPQWITKLGYQQGHWNDMTRPGPDELHVLVAIQDTMPDETIRRAVALSYQPQFLQDIEAAQQITYDAVMFASLAHTLSVASGIEIVTNDTTMQAGDTINLTAVLYDQFGKPIEDDGTLAQIRWEIHPSSRREGDGLVDATGDTASFTATRAHRSVRITASFDDDENRLMDEAVITIVPAPAHHLVIEGNRDGILSPHEDNPVGGRGYMRFSTTDTTKLAWAVIRDRFGNYVENSQSTLWDTLSPGGIVSAQAQDQSTGEGLITKLGPDGSGYVFARSNEYEGALFSDTIQVEVDKIEYESLRILSYESGQTFEVETLVVVTGRDTSLIVQGYRSDLQSWEEVPGNWSLSAQLRTDAAPPQAQAVWEFFSPVDTGSGVISAEYEELQAHIPAIFLPGQPGLLELYPRAGSPDEQTPYAPYLSGIADTIEAGESFEAWAKMFDINGIWLPEYETDSAKANLIRWQVSTDEEVEYTAEGARFSLVSTRAYRTINITASVIANGTTMSRTISVYITHGKPDHLVIEASATIANMINDDPINEITIDSTESSRNVFAILRDVFGNFAGYSTNTVWQSTDSDIFTAAAGEARDVGEGVASRVSDGNAQMIAIDGENEQLTDTISVTVQSYYYKELRIVNEMGDTLDTLRMNTNQETTLVVIGLRSDIDDQDVWERVQARWSNSDNLQITPTAPQLSSQWGFSPSDTASSGRIKVSQNNALTRPFSTHVIFDPGPPTQISIDILTPPDNRIAGEPIEALISIENEDGKVPGNLCGSAVFDDLLKDTSQNGEIYQPYVIIDGDTVLLSEVSELCFDGGNAIVDLVLFYAPPENRHTVSVSFSNESVPGLNDSERMVLNPGPVDSINLVQNNEKPFPGDTLVLDFDDGKSIRSIGFDQYGNYIGPTPAVWSTDGDIPKYSSSERMTQIYYQVSSILYEKSGIIIAKYDESIGDELPVRIRPQPAQLTQAYTRDNDGNGYLDAIDIVFNKEITFPDSFDMSNFVVEFDTEDYGTVYWEVQGISPSPGSEDSIFTLRLIENQDSMDGAPQTDWKPELSIHNAPDFGTISFDCLDGAGPVVWKVVRQVSGDGNRTKDKIMVEFSEDIVGSDGISIPLTTRPSDLFEVWVDSAGSINRMDLLNGIQSLSSSNARQIEFYMTNNGELTSYNLISINENSDLLVDNSEQRNRPHSNNRPTRLIVVGRAAELTVGPNPLRPTFAHSFDDLQAQEPSIAFDWTTRGGGVFVANIIVPGSDSTLSKSIMEFDIKGSLMVFDAIGNLVYTRKATRDELVEPISNRRWIPGTTEQLVFYWNGITDQDRAAAPGIYRTIMYLEIDGEQLKLSTNLGIGR